VQLSNTADRPALAQAWLDNGNADAGYHYHPFIITPPISRVDAKSGQTLRIKLGSSAGLAKDKETLWWLNLLEIPPVEARKMKGKIFCSWRFVRALSLFIALPD
jgi:P pilus assembly chaperone PapD